MLRVLLVAALSAAAPSLGSAPISTSLDDPASPLRCIPDGTFSSAELRFMQTRVDRTVELAWCTVAQTRHGGAHRAADKPMGSRLVLPVDERRVPIVDGFRPHLEFAATLPFPPDARLAAAALPPNVQCAVRQSLLRGDELEADRLDAISQHVRIADELRPLSGKLAALMPQHVFRIASNVNLAYMAVLIAALKYPDRELMCNFIHGFQVVGDIPDSGVYRPVVPTDSPADNDARYAALRYTASSRNRLLLKRLSARAHASPNEREHDLAVAVKTRKELAKGVVVGPFDTVAGLHHSIRTAAPHVSHDESYPLLMNRFGVEQKGAIRAVDDAKSNGANAATRMVETATTTHFYYPAVVARAAAELSRALGRPMPAMTVSLLDLAMAYRTIPSAQPWFTCVAYFDPLASPPRPAMYWLPGHNFGLVSAVVNFQRYPELVVASSRALHGVSAEHYVDDFILPDLASGGQSARMSLESLVLSLGSGAPRAPTAAVRCPEIDPAKTYSASPVNTVLGVVTNLTTLHTTGVVSFHVDGDRVSRVLDAFRTAFVRGTLSPRRRAERR